MGFAPAESPSWDQLPSQADVATVAVENKDSGRAIPPRVRRKVESRLGADLSTVRVHDDPLAQGATAAMGARAFAYGNDVFLGPGEKDTDLRLMAHELTHVVQQGADIAFARGHVPAQHAAGRCVARPRACPRGAAARCDTQHRAAPTAASETSVHERDADHASLGVMARLYGKRALTALLGPGELALDAPMNEAKTSAPVRRVVARAMAGEQVRPQQMSGFSLRACKSTPQPKPLDKARYQAITAELKTLIAAKKKVVEGGGGGDMADIDKKIDALIKELRDDFGVLMTKGRILNAAAANTNMLKMSGRIVKTPAGQPYHGQRLQYRAELDHLQPGQSVEYGWRWKAGSQKEYQFLAATGGFKRSRTPVLELSDGFWGLGGGPPAIAKAGGMEVLCHIYLGGSKRLVTLSSWGSLSFKRRFPQSSRSLVRPNER